MVIVMVGFYDELNVVFEPVAVAVGVRIGNNQNNVNKPPNAAHTTSKKLNYTRHVVFGIKPMDTQCTDENTQQQRC